MIKSIFIIVCLFLLSGCTSSVKNNVDPGLNYSKIIKAKKKQYGRAMEIKDILNKYGHYDKRFIKIKKGDSLTNLQTALEVFFKENLKNKKLILSKIKSKFKFEKDYTFNDLNDLVEYINFSNRFPFEAVKEVRNDLVRLTFKFSSKLEDKLKALEHSSLHNVIIIEDIKTIADAIGSSYDIDKYSADLLNTVKVNSFTGNAYDFISSIASSNNLYFESNNKIKIHQFEEKIYDISITPLSISSQSTSDLKKVTEEAAGASQSSLLGFGYKIYDELKETVKTIIGDHGMFHLNQASGQLVARGRPSNMMLVDKVVKKFNDMYSTKIDIELEIFEVKLNEEHSNGIDFSLLGGSGALSTSFKAISASLPFATASKGVTLRGHRIETMLKSLNTFGSVAITSKPSIQTLNSVPAVMNIAIEKDYISEISVTPATTTSGESFDIQKDTASDGMRLYLFPRVTKDDKVLITLQPQTVSLISLDSHKVGSLVEMQTKTISNREFSSTLLLKNGETSVMAGFISNYKKKDKQGLPFIQRDDAYTDFFGGSRDSLSEKTELVIVITARISK